MEHPIELVLPDEAPPVRLMNTVWADRHGVHDALVVADDLRRLLVDTGLAAAGTTPPSAAQVRAARRLRDALRRLAATVTGDDRARAATGLDETDAVDTVNAALAGAPNRRVLGRTDTGGWSFTLADEHTVEAALGTLAAGGAALIADPARPLRACRAPGCVLYFVRDHPRREWCSVGCGNRERAARHYRRSRTGG